ncbi:Type I secretion outer membrane protein, TolC precursor [Methylophaga thiooxydans]|uniref:Type I secretion outer membrane protein, TolC n=1 Tax=Methylophaga thiooxydans TaxID=392484 RepID=A0A0A0BGY3_9GAMM|nr:TolC family outer membrane protein [Methylophaga thiooxydans]KGM07201.1 Type I secretion outer membrane protein, TolC precursor [Methylophaga thiooxydans]
MKKIAINAFIASSLLVSQAWAENLIDVFELSLSSDPQLLAEAASRQAVGELDDQATANFLPQVDLTANTGKTWVDASSQSFGGQTEYNDHGYTLSLVQPLYRRQNFVQKEQADIAIEGADASYVAAEQSLIVRVSERYFGVLGAEDDLTFALAEREAIAKQLEQTQQRFDVGMATITDTTEAQAAFDLANAAVIAAENALANANEQLRETSGKYINELTGLQSDSPLVSPEPEDINQWSQTALVQNPSLMVAKSNVDSAAQTIELQKSGHYPSLDLVAQKNYASQSDGNFSGSSKTHTEAIGLQFNLPIYAGGAVVSRTREAGYRLDQAMQNEEQQRRFVTRQTRESFNGVMSGISRVQALKQAVVSNEKALESTQAGYEVGTRTTVDVLDARRNLFSARRDYARSRYDYILNTLRLKQAAGIVTVEDLVQINSWLGA